MKHVDLRRPTLLRLDVTELERALSFWHGLLGLPVKLRDERYAELQTEGLLISLHVVESVGPSESPVLAWEVEDLEAATRELEEAGLSFEEPSEEGWGGRRRGFRDPDGHRLEIVCFD